jgi:hypothetical protein
MNACRPFMAKVLPRVGSVSPCKPFGDCLEGDNAASNFAPKRCDFQIALSKM